MLTEFLAGIGINGAYDLVKTSVIGTFKEENSELIENVYNCIDCSAKSFFKNYGEKYGKPAESFLARQENYDVIVKYMYYSEQFPLKDKINRLGYNGVEVDEEAINYFIKCLMNEIKRYFKLDKILTEKESIAKINQIYESIVNHSSDAKDNDHNFTIKYEDGREIPIAKGRIYHKRFNNGLEYKIMIDDEGYHVEAKDIQGRITYCDMDFNGRIKYIKYPYALSEFELVIPNEQVLKQTNYKIPNGYGVIYEFKWGKKVIAEFNSLGKLTGFKANVRNRTDYNYKKIYILPEEEEKEQIHDL